MADSLHILTIFMIVVSIAILVLKIWNEGGLSIPLRDDIWVWSASLTPI